MRVKRGFTLVELMSSIVAGSVLAIAFGSVLMITQKQTDESKDIVDLKRNAEIIDQYISNKVAMCYGDSVEVYYNFLAEWLNIPTNYGHILHLKDVQGNDIRVASDYGQLTWAAGDNVNVPLDVNIQNLSFQKISTTHANRLKVSLNLVADNRTMNYGRMVYIRN